MICSVRGDCYNEGLKRACGHIACDECTEAATERCLYCVPLDEDEYNEAVRVAATVNIGMRVEG